MHKAGFKVLRPLEGRVTSLRAGQVFTYRQRFEPHMSIDPHKSFFNLVDKVPRVGDREETRTFTDASGNVFTVPVPEVGFDILDATNATKCKTRAENHFINAIGSMRIMMNGIIVEEWTNNIGELDAILKRLNNGNAYNILTEHQNFNRSYRDRYLDADTDYNDYQIFPEFSKFWRLLEQIRGGIELQIEITIHSDYLKRVIHTGHGTLPFTKSDGSVIGADPTAVTDKLTAPAAVTDADYIIKELDLYLWVEENTNVAPVMKPLVYNHSSWRIEKRNLGSELDQYFEFNLFPGIKKFGFVFQSTFAGSDTSFQVSNFTGAPKFTRGTGTTNFDSSIHFYNLTSQAKKLKSYEIIWGKEKLPFNPIDQAFVLGDSDTCRKQTYMRQLLYGNVHDLSGTYGYISEAVNGPIFIESLHGKDEDQKILQLRLLFDAAPTNLAMFYFFEYETTTVINYDMTGNAVQVVPSF